MILDKSIKLNIRGKNIKYYRDLGYDVSYGDFVEIKIEDLPKRSTLKVNVSCDVCGCRKILSLQKYYINKEKYNIYSCSNKCSHFKNKKTLKEKYGIDNFNRSEENKKKRKEKYDMVTKEIEKIGHICCSNCNNNYDLNDYLKNKNGRYKRICKRCRNNKFYQNRNKNPHIKAWRNVLKSVINRMGKVKYDKTINMLRYTSLDLKKHIEKLFNSNMSWDNYGNWHIDHIVHVSLFKEDTPVYIVNSLENLRPLESNLNISRHNNIDKECVDLLYKYKDYIKEEYKEYLK